MKLRDNYRAYGEMVTILDWEGNFISMGFVKGVEYIEGEHGWYTSLVLLTTDGKVLEGWKHMIQPFQPNLMLGYDNANV